MVAANRGRNVAPCNGLYGIDTQITRITYHVWLTLSKRNRVRDVGNEASPLGLFDYVPAPV